MKEEHYVECIDYKTLKFIKCDYSEKVHQWMFKKMIRFLEVLGTEHLWLSHSSPLDGDFGMAGHVRSPGRSLCP